MSSSEGNNIPLTAPPEEMFGRTMRISDDQLEEWYRLVREQPVPEGDPLEAKLELARFIVRRSWGDDGARAAEEHFTRVVREGGAPDDVPEVALPDGDPVHLPALLVERMGVGVDLGGAPADPAGRRQGERRRRSASSTSRATARGSASAGREAPFRSVDTLGRGAILPRPSERTAYESPCTSTQGAIRPTRIRYDSLVRLASGASRRLFYAVETRHRSLKTQQRTFFECRDLVRASTCGAWSRASTPRRSLGSDL